MEECKEILQTKLDDIKTPNSQPVQSENTLTTPKRNRLKHVKLNFAKVEVPPISDRIFALKSEKEIGSMTAPTPQSRAETGDCFSKFLDAREQKSQN